MASFNRWTGIGNLARDWEVRQLPGGTSVANSAIACNHKYKTKDGDEREEVLFLDLSAFGAAADLLAKYTNKGSPLFVTARLRLETWEDKNDGGKRSKISATVEDFQFLRGKDGDDAPPQQRQQQQQAKVGAGKTSRAAATSGDDQSIPF